MSELWGAVQCILAGIPTIMHHFAVNGVLVPPAKAHLCKRICILGPESSGTSTLASDLAWHYDTLRTSEFGRFYWEHREAYGMSTRDWSDDQFVMIADIQSRLEDDLARQSRHGLLICDTDALTTRVFQTQYGIAEADYRALELLLGIQSDRYTLYVLTDPDFGLVQDGTRQTDDGLRYEMYREFESQLNRWGRPYISVSGDYNQRIKQAREAIDPLLKFPEITR